MVKEEKVKKNKQDNEPTTSSWQKAEAIVTSSIPGITI